MAFIDGFAVVTLFSAFVLAALQVGPNPAAVPLPDGHEQLRERPPRESDDAFATPESEWLTKCLALVADDPARAHTLSQVERNETSGAPRILANHCLGLAATELGRWEDAVVAFGAARDETPDDELRVRARFGTMAGNAALAGGDPARAEAILRRAGQDAAAAASAPLQAIAATDLARALVALNQPEGALEQLQGAARLQPEDAEIWLLQATLLRRLDQLDEAQSAIERAGGLAPLNPQIGLEAGVIAILSGREDAARASWQSVVELEPESAAAQTAQDYLAQLGPPSSPPASEETS